MDPASTTATTTLFLPALRATKGFGTGLRSGCVSGKNHECSRCNNERKLLDESEFEGWGAAVVFDVLESGFLVAGCRRRGKGGGTSGKTPNKSVSS